MKKHIGIISESLVLQEYDNMYPTTKNGSPSTIATTDYVDKMVDDTHCYAAANNYLTNKKIDGGFQNINAKLDSNMASTKQQIASNNREVMKNSACVAVAAALIGVVGTGVVKWAIKKFGRNLSVTKALRVAQATKCGKIKDEYKRKDCGRNVARQLISKMQSSKLQSDNPSEIDKRISILKKYV